MDISRDHYSACYSKVGLSKETMPPQKWKNQVQVWISMVIIQCIHSVYWVGIFAHFIHSLIFHLLVQERQHRIVFN